MGTKPVTHAPWLLAFVLVQVAGFAAAVALLRLAAARYPLVGVFSGGIFHGQLMLAAVAAVFGPGGGVRRTALSALAVVLGVVLAFAAFPGRLDVDDAALFSFVLLLVWAVLQLPLWIAQWVLRRQARTATQPAGARSLWQFRLIHLLGLMLVVSLILGIGVPLWNALPQVAVAIIFYAPWLGLIATTTTLATFHAGFHRNGVRAAAVAVVLLAIGTCAFMPGGTLSAGMRVPMLLSVMACSYLWLQGSLLLARTAGYGLADRYLQARDRSAYDEATARSARNYG